MSADNWGYCPRCEAKRIKTENERADNLGKLYGKIPSDQYMERWNEAKTPLPRNSTLREDYEMSTGTGGNFYVSYSCSCEVCGFSHSFKHEEQLKV